MRRVLCWFGVHELPPGVQHQWSIVWACRCCGALVSGGLGRGPLSRRQRDRIAEAVSRSTKSRGEP